MLSRRSTLVFQILTALLGAGCGGGEKPAESGASASNGHEARPESSEPSSSANDEAKSAPAPKRAACDDGTCTPCGDALCPNGWYCDETAAGGPSCGWLPECAQKSGCACVKKALGCACEEKGGAAHLSCK